MTTPANRAPKFVVLTAEGLHCGSYATEQEARNNMLTSDCTVHPIGPALPAKVAVKSLAEIACDAYGGSPWFRASQQSWERAAAAVIAAHEAGKEWEVTERFAVRWFDGDGSKLWWIGAGWSTEKKFRALYATPVLASPHARNDGARVIRITTRRRRVVKS